VGIQWHPEFLITDFDKRVIKDFVENVKKNIK
jgi:gamma-glutamyl-gamma-aminobutyrate hydrolase PuuD